MTPRELVDSAEFVSVAVAGLAMILFSLGYLVGRR